jgi:hypothetical protein
VDSIKTLMRRCLSNLLNLVLMLVIPIWTWCAYLSVPRPSVWSRSMYFWIVFVALLLVSLASVFRASMKWPLVARVALGLLLTVFLAFLFFLLAFASAIAHSGRLP